jgi:hypothetical protein
MIYTITDVKKVCNQTLKAAFPSMKIYDNDTLDGYTRPSFFTEILSHGRTKTSRYLTQIGFTFRITYFEETHDEAHCLEVYEKICKAFEPAVKVAGHVRLVVRDTDYSWIDENSDKLQVTISFYDAVELGGYTEDTDTMEELDIDFSEREA